MIPPELALMWVYAWGVRIGKEHEMDITNENLGPTDLLETLMIEKTVQRPQMGGTWVTGTIGEHRFEALIFPEHAKQAEYELTGSRISKLWVQRISDRAQVANFDRGWDITPSTPISAGRRSGRNRVRQGRGQQLNSAASRGRGRTGLLSKGESNEGAGGADGSR
jgi:hypothetical protein